VSANFQNSKAYQLVIFCVALGVEIMHVGRIRHFVCLVLEFFKTMKCHFRILYNSLHVAPAPKGVSPLE
jgi:hypothetical protein